MRKKNGLTAMAAAATLLLCLPCTALAAGDVTVDGSTATKTYQFTVDDPTDLKYDAEPEITVDGKAFILDDVKYELGKLTQPASVVKAVQTTDQDKYPKEITETVAGKEYRLTAKTPAWSTEPISQEVREYAARADVPEALTVGEAAYRLTDVVAGTKTTDFSSDAAFNTPNTASPLYAFNGKIVTIAGNTPTWSGYEVDVAAYLGGNGSTYTITGAAWSGDFVKASGEYTRTATYSGTRETPIWTATYSADPVYDAEITYVDAAHPDGVYQATAMASYHAESNVVTTLLMIGGGVLVLALAAAVVIAVLRKKKKREEE
ncbi:MAG: hypothetical protein VB023_04435 [Oscillibacter sp.]|nr:hypothetical protein [Oscillibacter sp.]